MAYEVVPAPEVQPRINQFNDLERHYWQLAVSQLAQNPYCTRRVRSLWARGGSGRPRIELLHYRIRCEEMAPETYGYVFIATWLPGGWIGFTIEEHANRRGAIEGRVDLASIGAGR